MIKGGGSYTEMAYTRGSTVFFNALSLQFTSRSDAMIDEVILQADTVMTCLLSVSTLSHQTQHGLDQASLYTQVLKSGFQNFKEA